MTTANLERRFVSSDGVGIAYQHWGDERPSAPPVVLHHGFAVDHVLNWVVTGVVKALLDAGRTVVALDARGHGRSDKPHDPAFYGEANMARDLIQLFDLLCPPASGSINPEGAPGIDLVGYSMGAIVSLLAAAQDPRVRRLVVGGVGSAVVELGGLDTRTLPNSAIEAALRADDPLSITDLAALPFRRLADSIGADRLALAAQAARVHASPIALDRIRAATLVIAGAEDPIAARPEVLVNAIPQATLVLVPGDHLAAVADPGFAPAIVDFLARGL